MTIEAYRASLWLGSAVLLTVLGQVAWGCAGSNKMRHGDSIDVSTYPQDIQDAYQVFAVRCSRCHTLARPLNARITDAQHWVRYVTRMRRNPTSGINEKNAQVILHFLLYYMHQRAQDAKEAEEPNEPASDPTVTPAATPGAAPSSAEKPPPAATAHPTPGASDEADPPAALDPSAPAASPEKSP
jgi:hypothetical protein